MKTGKAITQEQAEEFVKLWQTSTTGVVVAKKLGLSRQRVHQIASQLRLAGVPLKQKKEPNSYDNALDIEKLKQLAIKFEIPMTRKKGKEDRANVQ